MAGMRVEQRLYALAATSEPDAAQELADCAKVVRGMREALEAAEYWLRAEAESPNPGSAKPDEMLRVLAAVIAKAEGR